MKAPFLIGRMIFGGFFLYNGINHLRNRKDMSSYAASKGVPAAELAVTVSAMPLLLGGASLLVGIKPKAGAVAVLAFLAGVSPIMHDFWRNEDPAERNNNMTSFMKNLALAGAAIALLGVDEPWEASIAVGRPGIAEKARSVARRIAA
jgi:putative oxidoreductase